MRPTYLSVDPVIRTDLLNFRQVTGPVMKENAPRLSSLEVCNFTYRIAGIIRGAYFSRRLSQLYYCYTVLNIGYF